MVTRSIENYEQHKKDILEVVSAKQGQEKAEKFIKFYSDRYDRFNRSFIDYKLAFWLMDDYHYVKRIGSRWYACVGVGGTGKTTIMKNVLYFLDTTFDLSRVTTDIKTYIESIDKLKDEEMKAFLLDEPDDTVPAHSQQGKVLRKIFGKIRQQKGFLAICATDLKDIPPYIFRKLDGILFCPCLGKGMFFKNRPTKGEYILQKIRNEYADKGYSVFFELRKTKGCITFDTSPLSPLDLSEGKEYLKSKREDYESDLKTFINMSKKKDKLPNETGLNEREIIIMNMKKDGVSDDKIASYFNLTRGRISQIVREIG